MFVDTWNSWSSIEGVTDGVEKIKIESARV